MSRARNIFNSRHLAVSTVWIRLFLYTVRLFHEVHTLWKSCSKESIDCRSANIRVRTTWFPFSLSPRLSLLYSSFLFISFLLFFTHSFLIKFVLFLVMKRILLYIYIYIWPFLKYYLINSRDVECMAEREKKKSNKVNWKIQGRAERWMVKSNCTVLWLCIIVSSS